MEENDNTHYPPIPIKYITEKVQPLIEEKNYVVAAKILKAALQKHPNQKELIKLYSDLKTKYKNEKIQQLQEEAVIFMRSGAEDKAQEKLREIYRLDPTRTELKDAFKKTRGEIANEYDKRSKKIELIDSFKYLLCIILAVVFSFSLLSLWHNYKHLNNCEALITSGNLYDARLELKQCGWFPGKRKQTINSRLQSEINNLIEQAHQTMELYDFQKAKEFLEIAAQAADDNSWIKTEIIKCEETEQQWQEELVKQEEEKEKEIEKQRILSEQALTAKQEFEKIFSQSLENKADVEAKDIFEIVKDKSQRAETLFSQNQFESAEKQWLSAAEDCNKALTIAAKIISARAAVLTFRQNCLASYESAKKINTSADACEAWLEAERIRESAEQKFAQNDFDAAKNLWLQAADKFNELSQIIKQSPDYQKAVTFCKKWQLLKPGLTEENILNFLGSPKCIQADSSGCIWYYQAVPTCDGNNTQKPEHGYICFEASSAQVLIDRNNKVYQRQVEDENSAHKDVIDALKRQIENENIVHRNFKPPVERAPYSSYSKSNRKRYVVHDSDTYQIENNRHDNRIKYLNNAIDKEYQRHLDRLLKLQNETDAKIEDLVNGLSPRKLFYSVSEWKVPNINKLSYFMESQQIEEATIKPDIKWQMPMQWRILKLNIREEDVYKVLGTPDDKSITEDGKTIYRYGQLKKYGFLIFEDCADSVKRLKYWKEPLWTNIK